METFNMGRSFRLNIAAISCFNVKNDPVLRGFSKLFGRNIEKSIEGWSQIVGALAVSGRNLGEYFKNMLIFSNSPTAQKIAGNPTGFGREALKNDLRILRSIVEQDPVDIETGLMDFYNTKDFDFSKLPLYDSGNFSFTVDDYIDFVRRSGSGIFAKYKAFSFNGELIPIEHPDPIRLGDLKNYEAQRERIIANTRCFLADKPAQNVLLYGDRGTGKSATVKAILNEYDALRMVEVLKNNIDKLPNLFEKLKGIPLHFIVAIDDLSFSENDDRFGILKAVLEGSLSAKPANVLIYATTNRRKIIRETLADREISGSDAIDESMSLTDRFGLFITFTKPDKRVYLDIVSRLAEDRNINISAEELSAGAESFALRHGGRSPRAARQYVDYLYGKLSLDSVR